MNAIERDIYVTYEKIAHPIRYVRGTNALSLVFRFCDFEIPEGTEARVYVQKPSGKAVYNNAVIKGNIVTVEVTTQMFIELGRCEIQIHLVKGEKTLVTFIQPVNVYKNYTEGDASESENETGFFQEIEDKINSAIQSADNATKSANDIVDLIRKKLEDGEFTGEQGPSGADGVITTTQGQIAFQIVDGYLYLYYHEGDTPPSCHIDDEGCLIMEFGGEV